MVQLKDIAVVELRRERSGCEKWVSNKIEGKDSNYIMSDSGQRFYRSFINQMVNDLYPLAGHSIVEIKVVERGQRFLKLQFILRDSRFESRVSAEALKLLRVRLSNQMETESTLPSARGFIGPKPNRKPIFRIGGCIWRSGTGREETGRVRRSFTAFVAWTPSLVLIRLPPKKIVYLPSPVFPSRSSRRSVVPDKHRSVGALPTSARPWPHHARRGCG